jgi:hypothetical protein
MEISDDLFQWIHPDKPEDLCFYNNDVPVFVSISHERDSYFITEEPVFRLSMQR